MFDQYLLPVKTAAMVFPALALALLVPFSFVAYRRRGRLGWLRSLVFFGFAYFAVAAFLLTLMPLPRDPRTVCASFPAAAHPQYALGNFVADFVKESHGRHGLAMVVGNPALYQVVFNAVMLAPLGIFLRYYAGRSLATTAAAGLGTSLLFELTQGTGVWGLYPCPYRLADVDDLLLNTYLPGRCCGCCRTWWPATRRPGAVPTWFSAAGCGRSRSTRWCRRPSPWC
jgi:hypothetical protein